MAEEETKEPNAEPPAVDEAAEASELISKANDAAERLEAGNKELAQLLAKQERMKVEDTLGGSASAGTPEKSEDEKQIEGAKALLAGTGLEDEAFPPEKE